MSGGLVSPCRGAPVIRRSGAWCLLRGATASRRPASVLLKEYGRYLRIERRGGEVTIAHYLRYASEFLTIAGMPPHGPATGARVAALDGAQVLDVVSRQDARHRIPRWARF